MTKRFVILPVTKVFGAVRKCHQPSPGAYTILEFTYISSAILQNNGSLAVLAITLNTDCSSYLRQHQCSSDYIKYQFHLPLLI